MERCIAGPVLFTDGRGDLAVYLTRLPSVAHTDHSVRRKQMASLSALIGNHLLVYRPCNGAVHVFFFAFERVLYHSAYPIRTDVRFLQKQD
jgi:hypothetical protein